MCASHRVISGHRIENYCQRVISLMAETDEPLSILIVLLVLVVALLLVVALVLIILLILVIALVLIVLLILVIVHDLHLLNRNTGIV